jgi:hypothetical protein
LEEKPLQLERQPPAQMKLLPQVSCCPAAVKKNKAEPLPLLL